MGLEKVVEKEGQSGSSKSAEALSIISESLKSLGDSNPIKVATPEPIKSSSDPFAVAKQEQASYQDMGLPSNFEETAPTELIAKPIIEKVGQVGTDILDTAKSFLDTIAKPKKQLNLIESVASAYNQFPLAIDSVSRGLTKQVQGIIDNIQEPDGFSFEKGATLFRDAIFALPAVMFEGQAGALEELSGVPVKQGAMKVLEGYTKLADTLLPFLTPGEGDSDFIKGLKTLVRGGVDWYAMAKGHKAAVEFFTKKNITLNPGEYERILAGEPIPNKAVTPELRRAVQEDFARKMGETAQQLRTGQLPKDIFREMKRGFNNIKIDRPAWQNFKNSMLDGMKRFLKNPREYLSEYGGLSAKDISKGKAEPFKAGERVTDETNSYEILQDQGGNVVKAKNLTTGKETVVSRSVLKREAPVEVKKIEPLEKQEKAEVKPSVSDKEPAVKSTVQETKKVEQSTIPLEPKGSKPLDTKLIEKMSDPKGVSITKGDFSTFQKFLGENKLPDPMTGSVYQVKGGGKEVVVAKLPINGESFLVYNTKNKSFRLRDTNLKPGQIDRKVSISTPEEARVMRERMGKEKSPEKIAELTQVDLKKDGTPRKVPAPEGKVGKLVRPEGKKISLSEKQALDTMIRAEERAAKYGYRAGQQEARVAITARLRRYYDLKAKDVQRSTEMQKLKTRIQDRFIQENKKDIARYAAENLPKEERGKFIKMVANAKTYRDVVKAFTRIDTAVERVNTRSMIGKIDAKVKKILDNSNISADYRDKVKKLMDLYNVKKPTKERVDRLRATEAFFNKEAAKGNNAVVPQEILSELAVLRRRNLSDLRPADLERIFDRISDLEKLGTTKQTTREQIWEMKKERDLEDIAKGSVPLEFIEKKAALPGETLSVMDSINNRIVEARNAASFANYALTPTDILFDVLDGNAGYRGPNYRLIKRPLDLAYGDHLKYKYELQDPIIALGHELKLNDANFERIGVYAAKVQKGGMEKLENLGLTKEFIEGIELTGPEMQWYKEARKKLDEIVPALSKASLELDNKKLEVVEDYFSMLTDFNSMSQMDIFKRVDRADMPIRTKNVDRKFLKERKGAGNQKIKINAMEVFLQHTDNVAYYLNMGRELKRISEMVATPEYAKAVGEKGAIFVNSWMDLMNKKGGVEGGQQVAALDMLRRNMGVATLGFRLSSALIQPTTLFDAANLLGAKVFEGALTISTSKEAREFFRNNVQELRERGGEDVSFIDLGPSKVSRNIQESAYWLLKQGDAFSAYSTVAGAYKKYMADHGLPMDYTKVNKEAVKYAEFVLRKTQATSIFKDLPLAMSKGKILSGGKMELFGNRSMNRMILQFQNFMLNKFHFLKHDIVKLGIKERDPGRIANAILLSGMSTISVVAIRQFLNYMQDAVFGVPNPEKNLDQDTMTQKMVNEYIQMIPFVSQIYSSSLYGNNPVPAIDMVSSIFEGISKGNSEFSSEKQKELGWIEFAAGLGKLAGVPGTGQVESFARDYVKGQSRPKSSSQKNKLGSGGGIKKLPKNKL